MYGEGDYTSRTRSLLKPLAFRVFALVFVFAGALALLELLFVILLHSPGVVAAAGGPMRRLVQQVYRHFNRSLIQFDARCARYDAELFYTLKPGSCTFGNLEFSNAYRVNSAGLRDDEAALSAPEMIVIGDSHAMGWGVEQDQSLVRVMAQKTGLKTLNAAVSSYATVREKLMLGRLDTSKLRVLAIQYADNDLPENRTFREQHDHLPISSRDLWETIGRYYTAQRRYYPGKYTVRLFMKVLKLEPPEPDQLRMDPITPEQEAELVLHAVVKAGPTSLDGVQLIVFEVNQEFGHPRRFIAALDQVARRPDYPEWVRHLVTLDTTRVLTDKDFYVLDDHMRVSGHLAVGTALAQIVQSARRAGGQ
jgi:hypothetical protein